MRQMTLEINESHLLLAISIRTRHETRREYSFGDAIARGTLTTQKETRDDVEP
jgi:hypothetical protein